MRQIILLVLALVAGLIAFFSSKSYLDKQELALREKFRTNMFVVAKRDIQVGSVLTGDMLTNEEKSADLEKQNAVVSDQRARQLLGARTQRLIKEGTVISWADLESAYLGVESLSGLLKTGDPVSRKPEEKIGVRAVSIPVDLVASVTQMVVPGDRVDIIGTFTFPSSKPDPTLDTVTLTILQDVLILATGKTTTRQMGSQAFLAQQVGGGMGLAYSTVTLEVTPQEAELIAFAIRRGGGNLMLSLRNREDLSIVWKPQSINFEYLEKHLSEYNIIRQKRLGRSVEE